MDINVGCYYLYRNGDLLLKKVEIEVEKEDPNCIFAWEVNPLDRGNAWTIAVEAMALGAKPERMNTLVRKWGLTDSDGMEFARRKGFNLTWNKPARQWTAKYTATTKKNKDLSGMGRTVLLALSALVKPSMPRLYPDGIPEELMEEELGKEE